MELRHLRYFVALAEKLNFTEAAKQMHVTQPTLSHQIRQLEDELGKTLFERSERKVSITASGELFLPKVQEALRLIENGVASLKVSPKKLAGHIRLMTSSSFNVNVIPQTIASFLEEHAAVKISIEESASDEIMCRKIKLGELDIAISYPPARTEGLLFEPLCNEELVLVVKAEHPLAQRKRVRVIELHRRDIILPPPRFSMRYLLEEAFDVAGAVPNIIVESSLITSVLGLVQQTGAATVLSQYALPAGTNLKVIPLEDPNPMRTLGLIWAKDKLRRPIEAEFTSVLRAVTNSIMAGPGRR